MAGLDTDTQPVVTPLDAALVKAVGDFCRWCAGAGLPVVRGWTNAVNRPPGAHIVVTPFSATWHATTSRSYSPGEDGRGRVTVARSMSRRVQVDFYGPDAQAQAQAVATLAQDMTGCDFLKPYALTPLTVTDPQELTGMAGNEQAEPRWMLELELQPGPEFAGVTVELDFFDNVNLGLHPQA